MNELDDFAEWCATRWYSPDSKPGEKDIAIMTLGLAGESGEVVEIVKKQFRDGVLNKDHLTSELGDVLYYWSRICTSYDIKPSDVMARCREKLLKPRNKMNREQLLLVIKQKLEEANDVDEFDGKDDEYSKADEIIELVLNSGVKK